MRAYEIKRGQLIALEVILWVICLLALAFVIIEYFDVIETNSIMLMFGLLKSIIH